MAIYKQVRDQDPENGQGDWTYGISLLYDMNDRQNGAAEIVKSQNVPYPYAPQDPREIVPFIDAYFIVGDKPGLIAVLDKYLPIVPSINASYFAQIAVKFDQMKQPDLSEHVLEIGEKVDAGTRQAYDDLIHPKAAAAPAAAAPAVKTPAPAATVATTSAGASGPRR